MWYRVTFLLRSAEPGQRDEEALWQDNTVLIEAGSEAEARQKAEQQGRQQAGAGVGPRGEPLRWRFEGVQEVVAHDGPVAERGSGPYWDFLRSQQPPSG